MMLVPARYMHSLGDRGRSYESQRSSAPVVFDPVDGPGVQGISDGVGAVFERTYRVRIAGSTHSPEDVLGFVVSNFNRAISVEVAEASERRPKGNGPEEDNSGRHAID